MDGHSESSDDSIAGGISPYEDEAEEEISPADNVGLALEPHEPPIIIGGGSLYIDMPGDKEMNEPIPDPALARPFRHSLASGGGGSIRALQTVSVLTEHRAGSMRVSFVTHSLAEGSDCELQIFLSQQRQGSSTVFIPIHASEPQIAIAGNPFKFEVDRELRGPEELPKEHSPFRYLHPGYKRRFRITRWRIVNSSGDVVVPGSANDDSYWFSIMFHHPH